MPETERPDLTIIVPYYDEPAYLRMAVASVLGQAIEKTEVLIVNDNPGVYQPAYFDGLTRDPRVHLLSHAANLGLAAARNTGLEQARGRWIGFLDSDDYFIASGLDQHLEYARACGAEITHALHWKRQIGEVRVNRNGRENSQFLETGTALGLSDSPRAQLINSSWCSLYSASFVSRTGVRFDPQQRKYEDRLFVLDAITQAETIAYSAVPARVYRKRGNSITTRCADEDSDLLKIALFEKCRRRMDDFAARHPDGEVFARREAALTLMNLLQAGGLVGRIAQAQRRGQTEAAQRCSRLLGPERIWEFLHDDELLKRSSGFKRLKTYLRPARDIDFLQDAIAGGDMQAAADLLERRVVGNQSTTAQPRAKMPPRIDKEVILHLGLHKTGTTYLQTEMLANRDLLDRNGVYLPRTGLPGEDAIHMRSGGFQGHSGLMRPLRMKVPKEEDSWLKLEQELATVDAPRIILSCENLSAPFAPNRINIHRKLARRLSRFAKARVVIFLRRPDSWIESLYTERVSQGAPEGEFSAGEFALDFGPGLLDLRAFLGPLEDALGQRLEFLDYDEARDSVGLWDRFWRHLGLDQIGSAVARPARPVYRSPPPAAIQAASLICRTIPDRDERRAALRSYFAALPPPRSSGGRLLSVQERRAMLELFEPSLEYAGLRGYAPDIAGMKQKLRDDVEAVPPPDSQSYFELAMSAQTFVRKTSG